MNHLASYVIWPCDDYSLVLGYRADKLHSIFYGSFFLPFLNDTELSNYLTARAIQCFTLINNLLNIRMHE